MLSLGSLQLVHFRTSEGVVKGHMEFFDPSDGPPPGLDLRELWECPVCGTQIAGGGDGHLSKMWCEMGHAKAEMEQKLMEAWRKDWSS